MVMVRSAVFGAALVAAGDAAQAMELRMVGPMLVLGGRLDWGAENVFKAFVDEKPPGTIKVVALDSGGGSIEAAKEIGRRIRKEGWATFVDARHALCASACTVVFAAGARRHYAGAQGISDGVAEFKAARGLGYHEGGNPESRQPLNYSGNATAGMIALYYEFGSREAASLATLAPPNRLYVLSGASALAKGIATSLSPP